MHPPPTLGHLNSDDWKRLQEIADRFEKAWQQIEGPSGTVDLAGFLPARDDPLRPVVLQELMKIDLEARCRRGQTVQLESYLKQFPELGTAKDISPQLIYEEYRVRHMYGDKPPLATYLNRFPDQYQELERLLNDQPLPTMTQAATPVSPVSNQDAKAPLSRPWPDDLRGYKLIKRIGTGSFGEVWRAEAPGGVEVAIKIILRPLDQEEGQRERQAVELIKRLRHPFLLQTQAFWAEDDHLYIVMELADDSLRGRFRECRKQGLPGIPLAELLTYFREAAEGLDYLHSEHVIHRDIKPENILLLKRHAKVADFGLVRLQPSQQSVSASGSGTPVYMAPEVWRGKVRGQSDQYSLAITYVELRLGRRPFASGDMMEIMFAHLQGQPDLDALPAAEQQVLQKALAKDPNERYGTCLEFVQALKRVLEPQLGLDSGQSVAPAAPPDLSTSTPPAKDSSWATLSKEAVAPQVLQHQRKAPTPSATDVQDSSAPPDKRQAHWRETEAKTSPRPGARKQQRRRFLGVALTLLGGLPAVSWLVYRYLHGQGSDEAVKTARPYVVYIPPGFEAAADAQLVRVSDQGKKLYSCIVYTTPAGSRDQFMLIPKKRQADPPTFYMMENKVWVKLFREFADAEPRFISNHEWEKDGAAVGKPWLNHKDWLPVMQVVALDAFYFAQWLGGGNLPTTAQWDKAAGAFEEDHGEGPFRGSWQAAVKPQIAVDRGDKGPMPVGQAKDDCSLFGCRDMAGNGQEWTRDVMFSDLNKRALPDHLLDTDSIILRGRLYTHPRPLFFKDLVDNKLRSLEVQPYKDPSSYIGFRVVLELPEDVAASPH